MYWKVTEYTNSKGIRKAVYNYFDFIETIPKRNPYFDGEEVVYPQAYQLVIKAIIIKVEENILDKLPKKAE